MFSKPKWKNMPCGTEAKNINKEDFLMIICGTNDMNQNFTGLLQLKCSIQDKLKHITNTNIIS